MQIGRLKGTSLYSFAIGLVLVSIGVTFLYILPNFIISTLNSTGIFCSANTSPSQCTATAQSCCYDAGGVIATAQAKVAQVQAVGFAVIILGLIFMLVGVVGGLGKK